MDERFHTCSLWLGNTDCVWEFEVLGFYLLVFDLNLMQVINKCDDVGVDIFLIAKDFRTQIPAVQHLAQLLFIYNVATLVNKFE